MSVFDKTGVEELGQFLASQGVEILSTGGTAKRLRSAGVEVIDASEYTGSVRRPFSKLHRICMVVFLLPPPRPPLQPPLPLLLRLLHCRNVVSFVV